MNSEVMYQTYGVMVSDKIEDVIDGHKIVCNFKAIVEYQMGQDITVNLSFLSITIDNIEVDEEELIFGTIQDMIVTVLESDININNTDYTFNLETDLREVGVLEDFQEELKEFIQEHSTSVITVADLISKLEHYPKDYPVVMPDMAPIKLVIESTYDDGVVIISDENGEEEDN